MGLPGREGPGPPLALQGEEAAGRAGGGAGAGSHPAHRLPEATEDFHTVSLSPPSTARGYGQALHYITHNTALLSILYLYYKLYTASHAALVRPSTAYNTTQPLSR